MQTILAAEQNVKMLLGYKDTEQTRAERRDER
jgi:hypothetical protein